MTNSLRVRLPLRVRLTTWYVMLLALTFAGFGIYLVFRFQSGLSAALDQSLRITVAKTIDSLDEADYRETGRLTFDVVRQVRAVSPEFAMRLVSPQGVVWDTYGETDIVPQWSGLTAGTSTQTGINGEKWRVYTQAMPGRNGDIIGWVQASQSLHSITNSVAELRAQLLFGIPLVLLFAALGGYFLADRALRPIQHIARTAAEINANDMTRRIAYHGPADEIGALAETFDGMLARLQSAFEQERRFSADAAHELRTPLTVLKGQIEVTLSRARGVAEYESKLRELAAQVDRLIRLSNALLFLSRSDQHQISFEPTSIDLHEFLAVLVEQFEPLAHEKNLRIESKIPSGLFVRGDADQLVRLFINLLENAVKYTPMGGEIHLSAEREAGEIIVRVHNSGAEILPEHLPHLFERFYRVDADRSSASGGSGLGLAISHEIARLHGGRLTVRSERGEGVTVSVGLPPSTK